MTDHLAMQRAAADAIVLFDTMYGNGKGFQAHMSAVLDDPARAGQLIVALLTLVETLCGGQAREMFRTRFIQGLADGN